MDLVDEVASEIEDKFFDLVSEKGLYLIEEWYVKSRFDLLFSHHIFQTRMETLMRRMGDEVGNAEPGNDSDPKNYGHFQ